ncbi:putative heat shock protein [Atlantibacter hermannii]|nr:putative heat shock protein [Atlantibacter hermannii]
MKMFIGFDYGTANCSVAIMRDGAPQMLTLENGSPLLPSNAVRADPRRH